MMNTDHHVKVQHRTALRHVARGLIVCMTLISPLAACSNMKTISWREQVRLHSGQVITVDRSEKFRSVYSGGPGPGWLFQNERLTAHFPKPIGDITWNGILTPIAVDVATNGNVYLVADIATLEGEKEYQVPDGVYQVAFEYLKNGNWEHIPLSTVPQEIRRNLFVNIYRLFIIQKSKQNFLDLALKSKMDADPRISRDMLDWPRPQK